MIDRSALANSFEFVVMAGARARQLMRGATPRVDDHRKATTVAQREVIEGRVEKAGQEPHGSEPGEPLTGQ
jgi:DNA-directed RNA polymerase subunit K/omega